MSIKVLQAVFDHSESTGSDRLILLAIADACDHDGAGCWKGKEALAAMARVSRTTATDAIRRLQERGELVVEPRDGRTNVYRVILPGIGDPAGIRPGQEADPAGGSAGRVAGGRPDGLPRSVPDPSSDPSHALSERVDQIAEKAKVLDATARALLAAWWESYDPRPAQNYPGALKIVRGFLQAGWSEDQVRSGLARVRPALTIAGLERELRRRIPGRVSATDLGALQ